MISINQFCYMFILYTSIICSILSSNHITCAHQITNGNSLHNLKYYEVIDLQSISSHRIAKRSAIANDDNGIGGHQIYSRKMSFKAMGKQFDIMLNPNLDIYSRDFNVYSVDSKGVKQKLNINYNEFYRGQIVGDKLSIVSAHIDHNGNGLMTASIITGDDVYVVEPNWRFRGNNSGNNDSMIIYKLSDVVIDHSDTHNNQTEFCDYIKIDDNSTEPDQRHLKHRSIKTKRDLHDDENDISSSDEFVPLGTHCALLLVADYSFYESMGDSSKQTTTNYLIHIIDRVNIIFNETEWKDDENQKGFKGMGFLIKEILIHTEPNNDPKHYNSNSRKSVREMLVAFSKNKYNSNFCLSHLFTHKTFENNVLGLAYVASERFNSYGGICSQSYQDKGETLYLNTGLTTTKDGFGHRIITRQSVLVTAHELAHNWGSEHDPHTEECSPPSKHGGSYIMYTYSVSGYDRNNKIFSPCSKRSIRAVLIAKSISCFSKPDKSYCGNFKVEEGEECDEGLLSTQEGKSVEGQCCDSFCKLLAGADCSDRNYRCCSNCHATPVGQKCEANNTLNCKKESLCDGNSFDCPKAKSQDDGTPCVDMGRCFNGICMSYCQTIAKNSCMCDTIENACQRCCQNSLTGICSPIQPKQTLSDGTPCHFGVCEKGRCEKKIQDFVERFWDVIEEININTFFKFLKDNIVGVVVVVSIILWIPLAFYINYLDTKRKNESKEKLEFYKRSLSAIQKNRKFRAQSFRTNHNVGGDLCINTNSLSQGTNQQSKTNKDNDESDDENGFNEPRKSRRNFPL